VRWAHHGSQCSPRILQETDAALATGRARQVGHLDALALLQAGVAKTGHQGAAHLARRHLGQQVQHIGLGLGLEQAAPVMLGAYALVQPLGDGACLRQRGRLHREDVHAVQDGVGYGALVVRRGDPDDLAGVYGHVGELVGEALRGVVLQEGVEGAQRVVLRVAGGLVDLVHHDHRIGIFAFHQGLEDLARARALPLR